MKPFYQDKDITIYNADCREILPQLDINSIDLLYFNPPFGITDASWDKGLDWNILWTDIWKILKERGVVALHSSIPFTFDLVSS